MIVNERGFRWDNNNDEGVYEDDDSSEEEESKYNPFSRGGNTAFTLEGEKALLDYFNEIKKKGDKNKGVSNNSHGETSTTYADFINNSGNNENKNKHYTNLEQYMKSYLNNYIESTNNINITKEDESKKEEKKKLTKKQIAESTQKAQNNWKNVSKKYSKASGIFIIKTIGAVVRALSFLKEAQSENIEKYSMEEQVHMYEILQSNSDIVSMLSKAHEERLRREAEQKKLEEDKEKLEQMKLEEERN